jgi:hypothetical protein
VNASPQIGRNICVYGAFALLAALVEVPLLLGLANDQPLGVVALPAGLVLPTVAFGLGWLTIGALFRDPAGRTPVLGAAVSLIALVPALAFLGWLLLGIITGR